MKNKKKKNEYHKAKPFLKLPTYPGGDEAIEKFLKENLKYPDEALKKNIEGIVHISFDVDHKGRVTRPKIIHGIGYGCDEEAVRLVEMLRFNATYNRGLRVTKRMKFRIPFTLRGGEFKIQYNLVEDTQEETENPEPGEERNDNDSGYGYTIRF